MQNYDEALQAYWGPPYCIRPFALIEGWQVNLQDYYYYQYPWGCLQELTKHIVLITVGAREAAATVRFLFWTTTGKYD